MREFRAVVAAGLPNTTGSAWKRHAAAVELLPIATGWARIARFDEGGEKW
jgi:hypothetical protein